MNLIHLLKIKWQIFGLDAPAFTWLAAALLIVVPLYLVLKLTWQVFRQKSLYASLVSKLASLVEGLEQHTKDGLPGSIYDSLVRILSNEDRTKPAWQAYNNQIILKRRRDGADSFWSAQSADSSFGQESLVESLINKSFYSAVPGIVTGLGLLCTFLAILVALLDVRLVDNRVQGLELLIQGLSGKFLSSIAALASATIFLVCEKNLFHSLARSRGKLVESIDSLVPQLVPARILADIEQDLAEQSNAFRDFNTHLAPMMQKSFSESMGPTLTRMVESIEGLNQLLRAAEAQKQESITGSLGSLLVSLESSLNESIKKMGSSFTESLSGNAMGQFDKIADSLKGTASLLEDMNKQFQSTQAALDGLINQAKNSAAEQMSIGRTQIDDLNAVLRDMITQIQQATGSSVQNMSQNLTETANAVIERADSWSSSNAEQLTKLLDSYKNNFDGIEAVRSALDGSVKGFTDAINKHSSITQGLQDVSREVNGTVRAITSAAEEMKNARSAFEEVAVMTSEQVDRLEKMSSSQKEVWDGIRQSMDIYKRSFSDVERTADALLNQITSHLNNHIQISKDGYDTLITTADEHFKNATSQLGATVQELGEHLESLTDILEKSKLSQ